MDAEIVNAAQGLRERTVARRRDFHKHAEAGWTEFRTASVVAKTLADLGYQVLTGDEAGGRDCHDGRPVRGGAGTPFSAGPGAGGSCGLG